MRSGFQVLYVLVCGVWGVEGVPVVPLVAAMEAENNNGAYSISHADESHAQERALSPQITALPHAVNLQWAGLSLSLFCCNYTVTLLINHEFCKNMASPTWPSIHRDQKKLYLTEHPMIPSSQFNHCLL